jgi:hypothetical protein
MSSLTTFTATASAAMRDAVVLRVEAADVIVSTGVPDEPDLVCEVLQTGALSALLLAPKDRVLVWQADPRVARAVVLGRIGLSHAPDAPEELVLEATKSLTLRVADGSITIRGDGKILIKGKDLVSHAQRMNRIRGGAVAIN